MAVVLILRYSKLIYVHSFDIKQIKNLESDVHMEEQWYFKITKIISILLICHR